MVLSTKALIEITNNLPQKEKELLEIKGIGKTKVEKYGKDIIAIIDQFTAENQLEGFVAQKMFFNQEKKNKK
jgi:superfamily II DNA helicase RecQ